MLFDSNNRSVVLALGTMSGVIGSQATSSENELIYISPWHGLEGSKDDVLTEADRETAVL